MIELTDNTLTVSFPQVHEAAHATIDFQRTLRIPDDGKAYPLPAGLGSFPLSCIEDYSEKAPAKWLEYGGLLLPMYQAEALWINFSSFYPMAIKISAGKIDAVTGEEWSEGLSNDPQNYVVVPDQPWLDGYCIESGLIRQFVAMPLGAGYSAEEQITGSSEFGGIQLMAYPMKAAAYEAYLARPKIHSYTTEGIFFSKCVMESSAMGLAPGGLMRQEIYEDEYGIDVWDTGNGSKCFVHLVNSAVYEDISGHAPPHKPMTPKDYQQQGVPWFDYYADGKAPLPGSGVLNKLKSLVSLGKEKHATFDGNESLVVTKTNKLGPGAPQVGSEGEF